MPFISSGQSNSSGRHTMKCWHCDNEAKAICVFCGRGICAAHRKAKPHYSGYGIKNRQFPGLFDPTPPSYEGSRSATSVQDASWCGVCEIERIETW
jgi:hypothetical protein